MNRQEVVKIVKRLIKKWDKMGYSPYSINCGNCDSFAQEILDQCPQGDIMWGEDVPKFFITKVDPLGHCFFKFKGYYYDSETPLGTRYPDGLKYYQRIPKNEKVFYRF